jgi:hypothetical protein
MLPLKIGKLITSSPHHDGRLAPEAQRGDSCKPRDSTSSQFRRFSTNGSEFKWCGANLLARTIEE